MSENKREMSDFDRIFYEAWLEMDPEIAEWFKDLVERENLVKRDKED